MAMGKMAARLALVVTTLCVLLSFIGSFAAAGKTGQITVYWGQKTSEGSLRQACDSKLYSTVIISYLSDFGSGNYKLNLAHHPLSEVGPDVEYCQNMKILVLLGIGGATGKYSLASTADAKDFADHLWNMYLGGKSNSRPFGTTVLDGIDFDIEQGSSMYYDDLARYLKIYSNGRRKKFLITAAPQCPYPDQMLGKALRTRVFDRVHVQFYNNPVCNYDPGNQIAMTSAWDMWTSKLPGSSIYLGLPAAPQAAGSGGYVDPATLKSKVLPIVQKKTNYGGIVLSSTYWDLQNGYSRAIKRAV